MHVALLGGWKEGIMMKVADRKDVARGDGAAAGSLRIMAIGKRMKNRWVMETSFARRPPRGGATKPAHAA
jgi:hypothetical protein